MLFPEKKFGFGCMRLPMKNKEVDFEEFSKMIDLYLENGFCYFDTAHGYIDGKSEKAIKKCLTDRYPREKFMLTNKLSDGYFKKESDIRPLFQSQLDLCGVEYFDWYLMHAQNRMNFRKYKKCRAYETALELKKEGKIRHFGISFHDKATILNKILTQYPQIEAVQIQFNYLDMESRIVESRKCYEVCRKHNKPIIVMEPVKGGKLATLPSKAESIFSKLDGSNASFAIRYAAGYEGVEMVLSGMGNMAMMEDNLSFMKDFKPLDDRELSAVRAVTGVLKKEAVIHCTGCRYCVNECPKNIEIPLMFNCINEKSNKNPDYKKVLDGYSGGMPSDCLKCGKCEKVCPQFIKIPKELNKNLKIFK